MKPLYLIKNKGQQVVKEQTTDQVLIQVGENKAEKRYQSYASHQFRKITEAVTARVRGLEVSHA